MKYDVPFIPNEPDNKHCYQASTLMVLKYFKPDASYSMDEWSKLTGFESEKGTWASQGLLWFNDNGFTAKHITLFDYDDFAKNGGEYLSRTYGQEVGEWQIAHTNLPLEQSRAAQIVAKGLVEKREPTITDIKQFLDQGYLVRVLVNSKKLNGKEGYTGHSVAVIGYDDRGLIVHNPGLEPKPGSHIDFATFEDAWADPNVESKELDAIKLTHA